MASFDARTAYANDYEHRDFVVDGTLYFREPNAVEKSNHPVKVELLEEANGEQRNFGPGLVAAPNEAVIELWATDASTPTPTHLDVVEFGQGVGTPDQDVRRWVIQRVVKSRYGRRWTMTAVEGRKNA